MGACRSICFRRLSLLLILATGCGGSGGAPDLVWGKRGVVVKGAVRALHRQPDAASQVVARAEPGVFARLLECRGGWCRIEAADIAGWLQRSEVWGVYPDEIVQ